MRTRLVVAASLFIAGIAALWQAREASGQGAQGQGAQSAPGRVEAGWVTLFDGSHLNEWQLQGNANWRLVDKLVQADLGFGFLVSRKEFTDFELRAEFWVDPTANSGIFFRCTNPNQVSLMTCYEANIFDTRPDQSYGTGAITNVAKVSPMPKAGSQWNVYEVSAKGPRLTLVLNGSRTVDIEHSQFRAGRIALQYAAGVVQFRKVQIRPL